MDVVSRFLSYVRFDTQSQPDADCFPSTEKQKIFAQYLVDELTSFGISDAKMDTWGYVTGTIPATIEKEVPVMGLIAHMDTEPGTSGANVQPRIVHQYDGEDLVLNEALGIVLEVSRFPHMKRYAGCDLIVTDGTTLLGADDKAGIAAIMTMAEILMADPSIPHGAIRLGFTPDEEVGTGVDHFDVSSFAAQYAYTVDGGDPGEISYENFNAAQARLTFHGVSVHPGGAKDQMINAARLAIELDTLLPEGQRPEHTDDRDGFFHLTQLTGETELANSEYLIRDHSKEKFQEKKDFLARCVQFLNEKYGPGTVELNLHDSYYNMAEVLRDQMDIVERARKAMRSLGIEPFSCAVRGGTDGCRLSYMGLPCPNLCTGGLNAHGRFECIPVQSLEKVTQILLALAKETVNG